MKILIAGAGKVGLAITKLLDSEGHDISILDCDAEKLGHISDAYDVFTLEGTATDLDLLREADAGSADLCIAVTGSDETNLVCAVVSRYLGAKQVVARVRDIKYNRQRAKLAECFGLSAMFNPDLEAAREIARILQFPSAVRVETFARGRLELVEYSVPAGSKLNGMPLNQLGQRYNTRILICAVEHDGKVCIPNGDFVLHDGDRLSIAGPRRELKRFFTAMNAYMRPVRSALLLGGSRSAAHLSRVLMEEGVDVTIIERRRERCEELAELLPGASVINGDGTKQEILLEEGLRTTDAFVALTGFDEDNIIVSMFARNCGVGKVVTKLSDDHFIPMLKTSGLDCFVCPKLLAASEIARYVRAMGNAADSSSVDNLYRLIDNQIEALEFAVGAQSRCVGKALRDLHTKNDVLIAGLLHGDTYIVPNGNTVISAGDKAVVVTTQRGLRELDSILE